MSTIYTIGYGNRKIHDFINLLKQYDIQYLVDVRSAPYSKFNPDFSSRSLQGFLRERNIKYLYLGDQLGGRPKDPDCYLPDGRVDYHAIEDKAFYREGIERLETASIQGYNVVVMCSELRPEECHRTKLIGMTLTNRGIPVSHIDENGNVKSQADVIEMLREKAGLNKPQQLGLMFDENQPAPEPQEEILFTSRKAYQPGKATDE